jgi:hypothetical protein
MPLQLLEVRRSPQTENALWCHQQNTLVLFLVQDVGMLVAEVVGLLFFETRGFPEGRQFRDANEWFEGGGPVPGAELGLVHSVLGNGNWALGKYGASWVCAWHEA